MFNDRIRLLEVTESTNAFLKAEVELGRGVEGAVVQAEHQTAGRGRNERRWEAPPGKALLFSILLKPQLADDQTPLVALMAGMAVLEGLKQTLGKIPGLDPNRINCLRLKWPNDILFENAKLCGILCETAVNPKEGAYVIVGVGVNVNQDKEDFAPELRISATSLKMAFGVKMARETLLGDILESLESSYERLNSEGTGWIASEWLAMAGIQGKPVEVKYSGETVHGVCEGLTANGAMALKRIDGTVAIIYSGDMSP